MLSAMHIPSSILPSPAFYRRLLSALLVPLVGPLALAAQAVHIQRIVSQTETLQLGMRNGILKRRILTLRHLPALSTNQVMVRIPVVRLFVLRCGAELMFDDQPCLNQQDDGIVQRGPTDTKVFFVGHLRIERIDVKMTLHGVDSIEYSISFGSLSMPVRIQIFGEYLPYRIFHILIVHDCVMMLFHSRQS